MRKRYYKDIFKAIKYGDIEAIKKFLPEHANDRCPTQFNKTPLSYTISVAENYTDIFNLLLDNGADASGGQDDSNESLLWYLWWYKCPELIQAAAEHGMDIESTYTLHYDDGDKTYRYLPYLCQQLEAQFEAHGYDKSNMNMLAVIKELVRCGARTDIPDEKGKLPLDYLPEDARAEVDAILANLQIEKQSTQDYLIDFAYEV